MIWRKVRGSFTRALAGMGRSALGATFATMEPEALDLSSLMNAVTRLEAAFSRSPGNDLERDGGIQRFEYTYELCWKMIRR